MRYVMLKKQLFFLLILISLSDSIYSFPTIHDARSYANMVEEYPDIDNENWLSPDYTAYYKKNIPSFMTRILTKMGVRSKPLWSPAEFKALVQRVVNQREINGFVGRYVVRKVLPPQTNVVIVGELHGAFHSLVRLLEELQKQNIIDDTFTVIKPDYYLVFLGNIVDGSPYILETLTLVLKLLQNNPNKVICLKGQREDKHSWYDFGLKRELQIRLQGSSREKIPLEKLINRFFETLPLALYIQVQNNTQEVLRISAYGRENEELNELYFDEFFVDSTDKLDIYQINRREKSPLPVTIKTIIKSTDRSKLLRSSSGLDLLQPDRGITAWSILSSPTRMYHMLYAFFYDAYVVLKLGNTFAESTLTLLNQDVREQHGFSETARYDLVTGKLFEPEVSSPQKVATPVLSKTQEGPIRLGSTLDLSKGVSPVGMVVEQAMMMRIQKENNSGGINGRKIQLTVLDDEYTPDKARKNIERLMRESMSDILLCPVGTPTLESVLDLIKQNKILVLFPITGAPIFRSPELTSIVHCTPSYLDEARALVEFLVKNYTPKSVAIFYQNDSFGLSAVKEARVYLEKAGVTEITEISYMHNSLDFKDNVEKISKLQVDVFGFFSTAIAAKELIKQVGTTAFIDKKLFGLSDLGQTEFKEFLRKQGLPWIIAQRVPDPQKSSLEIVQEFRTDAEKNKLPLDVFALEAYIGTSLTIDFLKKISGPITKESLQKVIKDTKNYAYKGLQLSYNPETGELINNVWLDTGEGDWIISTPEQSQKTVTPLPAPNSGKIKLGTSLNLRKGASAQAKQLEIGYNIAVKQANQNGGINGQNIEFVVMDDEYIPKKARENIEKMLQDNISIFVGVSGSANLEEVLDLIKDNKILVLFPITGAPKFHKPELKYIVHFAASYDKQGAAITKYMREKFQVDSIVFFYQNDAFGLGALEGAREALKNTTVKIHEIPYERGDANFKVQVETLKNIKFDALGFFSTAIAAKELIRQATPSVLFGKKLFGVSDVGEEVFKKFLTEQGLQITATHLVPNPQKSDLEIVKEYRQEMQKNNQSIDAFSLEAYITMSIVIDVMKKVQGPITKEKILAVVEALKNYDYKGIKLNFDENTRELASDVWVSTDDEEWVKL